MPVSVFYFTHLSPQLPSQHVSPTRLSESRGVSTGQTYHTLPHPSSYGIAHSSSPTWGPLEPPSTPKPWSMSCLRPAPPLRPSAALAQKEVLYLSVLKTLSIPKYVFYLFPSVINSLDLILVEWRFTCCIFAFPVKLGLQLHFYHICRIWVRVLRTWRSCSPRGSQRGNLQKRTSQPGKVRLWSKSLVTAMFFRYLLSSVSLIVQQYVFVFVLFFFF